jgi:hypothetical protein
MLSCDQMLKKRFRVPAVAAAVRPYLHHTLGIDTVLRPWEGASKLPYFLQDSYELRELRLLDHPVLLAINRRKTTPAPADIRSQLDKLKTLAGRPVVYVTDTLASYERRRLIEQKVPFIVPGNQLYLPALGIDLREYFRQRPEAPETALSPATQALLISVLLREPWNADWQPAETAAGLGYTAMTLSRAVKELSAAGIATVRYEGRTRWLRLDLPPAKIWEKTKPLLRSPVKRSAWARLDTSVLKARLPLAGLSALARQSMLADPPSPVYAVTTSQWKAAVQAGLEALPEATPDASQWQVWSYSPALLPESKTVDPLSLTLSFQDNPDERIQLALDELQERFPW